MKQYLLGTRCSSRAGLYTLLCLGLVTSAAEARQLTVGPTAYPGGVYVFPSSGAPGPAPAPAPAPGPQNAHQSTPDYTQHGTDWFMGMCRSRSKQSPINLERLGTTPPTQTMDYHYDPITGAVPLQAVGGMLMVDLSQQEWGGAVYSGQTYLLTSMVIHGPAEHLIDNVRNPLEIQLVHRSMKNPAQQLTISIPISCAKPPPKPVKVRERKFIRRPWIGAGSAASSASSLSSGAPGPAPAPAPAPPPLPPPTTTTTTTTPYSVPRKIEAAFNADLQQFLLARPPFAEGQTVSVQLKSFDLSRLVETVGGKDQGAFFGYSGSQTSAPCLDSTMWFVRRNPLMASNGQVKALADALYKITNDFGSYRDIMPTNRRIVEVYRLQNVPLLSIPVENRLPWGSNPRTDSEMKAQTLAKLAKDEAENAANYIKDFESRLRSHQTAYAEALAKATPPPEDPEVVRRREEEKHLVSRVRSMLTGDANNASATVQQAFRGNRDAMNKEVQMINRQMSGALAPAPAPAPAAVGVR